MNDDKISNKLKFKIPYKSNELFGNNKIDDQWSENELKSFDDLMPKNDDDFEWCMPTMSCISIYQLNFDFSNIYRNMNLLYLRNVVSEVGNRYVATHTIEKHLSDHLRNFNVKPDIKTTTLKRVPFSLPEEYAKCLNEKIKHKEKKIQDPKRFDPYIPSTSKCHKYYST